MSDANTGEPSILPGGAARGRFDWNAARVALLRQRWGEGASAASIAQELGEGISRSAVLGKIHRLKLTQPEFKRLHPQKERAALKRKRAPRPARDRAVRAPSALLAAFRALGLDAAFPATDAGQQHNHANTAFGPACGLLELTAASCRWPVGEGSPADFRFCGAPPFKRYPYCVAHCLIAYRLEATEARASAPPRVIRSAEPVFARARAA